MVSSYTHSRSHLLCMAFQRHHLTAISTGSLSFWFRAHSYTFERGWGSGMSSCSHRTSCSFGRAVPAINHICHICNCCPTVQACQACLAQRFAPDCHSVTGSTASYQDEDLTTLAPPPRPDFV